MRGFMVIYLSKPLWLDIEFFQIYFAIRNKIAVSIDVSILCAFLVFSFTCIWGMDLCVNILEASNT